MAENIENNILGKVGETDCVQDNKQDKRISLAQSLSAYRCISTDKSLTWKQNYVNEKFGLDLYFVYNSKSKKQDDDIAEAICIAWSKIRPKEIMFGRR